MAAGKRGGEPGKRGGGRTEGVEASPGAGTGRRLSLQREAGGGACVRGAFSRRQQQLWGEGRKTTGGVAVAGWADCAGLPGEWASGKRQVSPTLLCFIFFFCFVLFNLVLPLF